MAIVQTVNLYQFREAFRSMNRQNQFSYEGLEVLFDYLDNLSDDIEEPIELDVIALCCDYYESSIEDLIRDYNIDCTIDGEPMDDDEIKETIREYLEYHTSVCGEVEGGFIYAAF